MSFWTEEQLAAIDKMLNPRSIAVVGATPKGSYGKRLLEAVLKSKDRVRVYPVNPNYDEIMGTKTYASVAALPSCRSGRRSRRPHSAGVLISSGAPTPWRMPSPVPMSCSSRSEKSLIVFRSKSGFALVAVV